MLPPQKEHFDMLLTFRREFKGVVGITLAQLRCAFTPAWVS
jgi:hypothetical protein